MGTARLHHEEDARDNTGGAYELYSRDGGGVIAIYLSIAAEDRALRDVVVAAAPGVDWVDMPLDRPYDGAWRMASRARLLNCAGVVILFGRTSQRSAHQQWVARCAVADRRRTLLLAAAPDLQPEPPFASWPAAPLGADSVAAFIAAL
jgi:hypothetical protein